MSYLVVLGINFENNIFIFQISTLEFVLLQSLLQKLRSLNLGPKMPDYSNVGLEF